MRNDLHVKSRNDLRRTLGEMESLAPLAPELETRPVDLQPRRRSGPNPFLVALGAAALVFALALPVVLQSTNPDVGATEEPPPPTTTPATPTTNPPTTAATTPEGWILTEVPYVQPLLEVTDQGFVAFSSHEVRTSSDGLTWQNVGSLGESVWIFDIEHRGDTLVAAGRGFVDEETGEAPPDAVWTSTDGGRTWTSTELDDGGVADIAVTPDGFAAVGVEFDNSDPDYNKTHGTLWTSPDGLTWTQAARSNDPEGVSSNFRNVVWDDQLIILGHRGLDYPSEGNPSDDPEPHDNVTWFSDGTSLSKPSVSTLVGNLDEDSTAVTPFGIIATTHWSTPTIKTEAAAWISQDGVTWTRLDIESGNYEYTDIAQYGDEVFLIGYEIEGDDKSVWTTADGSTWNRIALPNTSLRGVALEVAVSESALVIAGDHQAGGVIAGMPRN